MTRPRVKHAATAVAATLAGVLLAGCGGQSPYCGAVEKNADTLNSFGKTRTDAAYTSYSKTFKSIAKDAPAGVKDDWTTLAKVTDGVLAAQKKVGLPLEDMRDEKVVAELDDAQLKTLNDAYEAFNATADQRTAVVKNAKTECEITLK
ncbi:MULTISPECIES: hypothetical protein [unclassified Aeromicrobium]|jgi:hypothetical protein|uniref:hypothetical protein n=1 Tax=unclassified Aeromicrobium TaxID=2633570 RepID=UPI00288BC543|nr:MULTISPECIES: hypothetical protein [unclassified Aeromicrobium]